MRSWRTTCAGRWKRPQRDSEDPAVSPTRLAACNQRAWRSPSPRHRHSGRGGSGGALPARQVASSLEADGWPAQGCGAGYGVALRANRARMTQTRRITFQRTHARSLTHAHTLSARRRGTGRGSAHRGAGRGAERAAAHAGVCEPHTAGLAGADRAQAAGMSVSGARLCVRDSSTGACARARLCSPASLAKQIRFIQLRNTCSDYQLPRALRIFSLDASLRLARSPPFAEQAEPVSLTRSPSI